MNTKPIETESTQPSENNVLPEDNEPPITNDKDKNKDDKSRRQERYIGIALKYLKFIDPLAYQENIEKLIFWKFI